MNMLQQKLLESNHIIASYVFCDAQFVFSTRSYSSTDIAEASNGHCYNVPT